MAKKNTRFLSCCNFCCCWFNHYPHTFVKEMTIILGIDLGTTSVKVNCTQFERSDHCYKVLQRRSLSYHHHLASKEFSRLNEDNLSDLIKVGEINPYLVLSALVVCIEQLDVELRRRVQAIGLAGQMHGVLYWNQQCLNQIRSTQLSKLNFNLKFNKNFDHLNSSLYTWENSRCTKKFLDQLPDNLDFENRHAYTGFGVATTFWFLKNEPDRLSNYCFMGSIMDFVVHLICPDLEHPVTSVQLANSYGYFDMKTNDWSTHLDGTKFPKHLLPKVLNDNQLAGRLKNEFLALQDNVPVFVACGDLQCAIYSAMIEKDRTAIFNSGTSLQLAFPIRRQDLKELRSMRLLKILSSKIDLSIDRPELLPKNCPTNVHLDIVPYFDGDYLVTCSSLNGGNVIAFFVKSIGTWINSLFVDTEIKRLNETDLWSRINSLAKCYIEENEPTNSESDACDEESSKVELDIQPRLYGERYEEIKSSFSINSITTTNFELGRMYYALCSSIIDNVFRMCPISLLKEIEIEQICSVGSSIKQNEILRICLEQKLNANGMRLIYENETVEADLGIAMVTMRHLCNLNQF